MAQSLERTTGTWHRGGKTKEIERLMLNENDYD
jgi:hypothetical protein